MELSRREGRADESYLGYLSFSRGEQIPPSLLLTLPTPSKRDLISFKPKQTQVSEKSSATIDYKQLGLTPTKPLPIKNSVAYHKDEQSTESVGRQNEYTSGCGQFWTCANQGVIKLRVLPKVDGNFAPTDCTPGY